MQTVTVKTDDPVAAAQEYVKTHVAEVVTAVAAVGVFLIVRKLSKTVHAEYAAAAKFQKFCLDNIEALKNHGEDFTFYPGVGIYAEGRKVADYVATAA